MQASRESKQRGGGARGNASKLKRTGRASKATTASEPSEDEQDHGYGRRGGVVDLNAMNLGDGFVDESANALRRAGTNIANMRDDAGGQLGGSRLTVSVDPDDEMARAAKEDAEFEQFADRCGQFEIAVAERAMTIDHFDL